MVQAMCKRCSCNSCHIGVHMLIVSDDLALQYHSSHSGVLACSLGQQHCSPEMPEMPQNAHRRLHRLNVGLHAKTGCQALPPVDVQAPVWHQSQQKPQILHRSPSTAALAIWGVQQPVCTYNTDCSVCQEVACKSLVNAQNPYIQGSSKVTVALSCCQSHLSHVY